MDTVLNRGWLTKEESEAFIGKNSSFYMDNWKSYSDSALKGWNWAAMFFSIEWMAYRKMYMEALLYFIITAFISVCTGVFLASLGIGFSGRLAGDALGLLMGMFANALYRKKALRILHKTDGMDDSQRIRFMKEKGGVSVAGCIACIVIELVYGFLIALL